jgi:hypothetical protein
MNRIFRISVAAAFLYVSGAALSAAETSPQKINLEPVIGQARSYRSAIKFTSVNRVYVRTLISAESLGHEKEISDIPSNEWSFDASTGIVNIRRDIDLSVFTPVAEGKYASPITIMTAKDIDPGSIRVAVNWKIGVKGTDYIYNGINGEISLPRCITGDENFFLSYRTGKGGCSISSGIPSEMNRKLRSYFELPLEGNTRRSNELGTGFTLTDGSLKSVWLVELIPTGDGYGGKSIRSGFTWNREKNELELSEPVDTSKFSVYVFGEE